MFYVLYPSAGEPAIQVYYTLAKRAKELLFFSFPRPMSHHRYITTRFSFFFFFLQIDKTHPKSPGVPADFTAVSAQGDDLDFLRLFQIKMQLFFSAKTH